MKNVTERNLRQVLTTIREAVGNLSPDSGGGFRRIYVDTVHGSDGNTGLSSGDAYQTWEKCQEAMADTGSVEVTVLSELPALLIENCPNVFIVIPEPIDVSEGGIVITNSNVRITGDINVLQNLRIVDVTNSGVVFNGTITASAADPNYPVVFLDVRDMSVIRFKQFVITDTAGHINTIPYRIEEGSEVYIAGRAKHRNPYFVPAYFDPGEGAPLPDGHILGVIDGESEEYVFPVKEEE
jgi:hypothetical protein